MILLPWKQFDMKTKLSVANIETILDSIVNTKSTGTGFFGQVNNSQFRIIRKSKGLDSFQPVIIGKIITENLGSRIQLTMRLHTIVLVIISAVILFYSYTLIVGIKKTQLIDVFMSSLVIILIYSFALISFNKAVKRNKDYLTQLFKIGES